MNNFRCTLDEFLEAILKCYPRPTPWIDPSPPNRRTILKKLRRAHDRLQYYCQHGLMVSFFEELERLCNVLLSEMKGGKDRQLIVRCTFDALSVLLRRAGRCWAVVSEPTPEERFSHLVSLGEELVSLAATMRVGTVALTAEE